MLEENLKILLYSLVLFERLQDAHKYSINTQLYVYSSHMKRHVQIHNIKGYNIKGYLERHNFLGNNFLDSKHQDELGLRKVSLRSEKSFAISNSI